jgi:hypothetical protein
VLNCACCKKADFEAPLAKFEDFAGLQAKVRGTQENLTIVLEILKYYGRDINLVEVYDMFRSVHKKYIEDSKRRQQQQPHLA